MSPKESRTQVPGRVALSAFAEACREETAERFAADHPDPILVQLTEGPRTEVAKPNAFATIFPETPAPKSQAKKHGLWVYEVKKRPGANAFALMVTLGRTKNNDVIVDDPSVSKFHASFKTDPGGQWTITDTSSGGTRLDGEKIERDKPARLRSGARLLLAEKIELIFYLPLQALDHMKRVTA